MFTWILQQVQDLEISRPLEPALSALVGKQAVGVWSTQDKDNWVRRHWEGKFDGYGPCKCSVPWSTLPFAQFMADWVLVHGVCCAEEYMRHLAICIADSGNSQLQIQFFLLLSMLHYIVDMYGCTLWAAKMGKVIELYDLREFMGLTMTRPGPLRKQLIRNGINHHSLFDTRDTCNALIAQAKAEYPEWLKAAADIQLLAFLPRVLKDVVCGYL